MITELFYSYVLSRATNVTKTVPPGGTGGSGIPGYDITTNRQLGATYDSNGNLLTDGFHTYVWDSDNNLTKVDTLPTVYNAFGKEAEWKLPDRTYRQIVDTRIGRMILNGTTATVRAMAALPGGGAHAQTSLSMSLAVDPTFNIDSNGNQTYTAAVTNTGGNGTSNLTVKFVLPPDDIPISPPPSGGCTFASDATAVTATCTGNPLPPGRTSSFVVAVHPTNTSQKSVTASASESGGGSASASVTSDIIEVSITDIEVTLADSPDPALVNLPLTYTIRGLNIQDDTATGVFMTLTLPVGVQFVSAPGCMRVRRLITCRAGDLNPGESATFNVNVIPRVSGWLYASAGTRLATPDPSIANNSAAARTWSTRRSQTPRNASFVSLVMSRIRQHEGHLFSPVRTLTCLRRAAPIA